MCDEVSNHYPAYHPSASAALREQQPFSLLAHECFAIIFFVLGHSGLMIQDFINLCFGLFLNLFFKLNGRHGLVRDSIANFKFVFGHNYRFNLAARNDRKADVYFSKTIFYLLSLIVLRIVAIVQDLLKYACSLSDTSLQSVI